MGRDSEEDFPDLNIYNKIERSGSRLHSLPCSFTRLTSVKFPNRFFIIKKVIKLMMNKVELPMMYGLLKAFRGSFIPGAL